MKKRKARQMFYRKWRNYTLISRLKCDDCNGAILYFCRYDADFCPQCDKWITKNCDDPACLYCADRPEMPGDALAACKMLRNEEQVRQNKVKERAIRHYVANKKYKYQGKHN